MRIVVVGLTLSSSWGYGHATLWRGLRGGSACTDDLALAMDEGERARIAAAARELEQHTADRRARELEGRLASIPAARPERAGAAAARKESSTSR